MNFSKTTTYAIKVLTHMSAKPDIQFSAKTLHIELNIPYQYLRFLMSSLAKSGFIRPNFGRTGGFVLNRIYDEITLADVVDAVEGLDRIQNCILGYTDCDLNGSCSLHEFWVETRKSIIDKLKNTRISEIRI